MKTIVIIGAGNGISFGVARRFGRMGFKVVLINRNDNLQKVKSLLKSENVDVDHYLCDAANYAELAKTLKIIIDKHKSIEVLHFNLAQVRSGNILEENSDSLIKGFEINVASFLTAVNLTLPTMLAQEEGCILVTGGGFAIYPNSEFANLSIGKAALRVLANLLHDELKEKSIHVGSVIVCGLVNEESEKYNPHSIAEQFLNLYEQRNIKEIAY